MTVAPAFLVKTDAIDVALVAGEIAQDYLDDLHEMVARFGMPPHVASTLELAWDGTQFVATSPSMELQNLEYGDGKKPPLAAVRKTMNRLRPRMLVDLADRFDAQVEEHLLEEVAF